MTPAETRARRGACAYGTARKIADDRGASDDADRWRAATAQCASLFFAMSVDLARVEAEKKDTDKRRKSGRDMTK